MSESDLSELDGDDAVVTLADRVAPVPPSVETPIPVKGQYDAAIIGFCGFSFTRKGGKFVVCGK